MRAARRESAGHGTGGGACRRQPGNRNGARRFRCAGGVCRLAAGHRQGRLCRQRTGSTGGRCRAALLRRLGRHPVRLDVGAPGGADGGGMVGGAPDDARMAAMAAGDAGAIRVRCALLPRRLEGCQSPRRKYGPAGGARHYGGVWPERLFGAFAFPGDVAPVFRSVGGGLDPGPAGQVAGGARQAADCLGNPCLAGLAAGDRARAARRRTGCRPADRTGAGRRYRGDPRGRARSGGRRGDRWRQPCRRVPDHRREPAGRQACGRAGDRRRNQWRGPAPGTHQRDRC